MAEGRLDRVKHQFKSLGRTLHGDDPYWNFERIMTLERELGVRSTFFFLNESGRPSLVHPQSFVLFKGRYTFEEPRIRSVIRELCSGGWEVALHGSYYSYQDAVLLRQEKENLETILGEPVRGVRQHYLNLDVPETWKIQANVGFVYDSSWGYPHWAGFRGEAVGPFFPTDPVSGEGLSVLELPMAIMDSYLMEMEEPWREVLKCIELAEEASGVLTVNWHQRVLNPLEYPERYDLYIRLIQECQHRGAWIAPLKEIAKEWVDASKG